MARGKVKSPIQKLEEQIKSYDEKIAVAQEKIKSLKEAKSQAEKELKNLQVAELYNVISESGKTIDDVKKMLGNK